VTETPEPSEQRPEEAPPEQVHEDTSGGRGSDESPGVPGEHDDTATGNPDAAGAEEPEEDSAGE
jgi:hypothetical protein